MVSFNDNNSSSKHNLLLKPDKLNSFYYWLLEFPFPKLEYKAFWLDNF